MNSKHEQSSVVYIRRVYKINAPALLGFKPVCQHTPERGTGKLARNGKGGDWKKEKIRVTLHWHWHWLFI
jgi:hypothetical protein